MELLFNINRRGALYSRRLQAVVDFDQEAGTLYGFASKLVLRSMINENNCSILVSRGEPAIIRHGDHVIATVNSTFYARFHINNVLGRLECAPEPRLIYLQAFYHAITSFVMPDPLTGKTGTEEALYLLQAGAAQPWAPITDEVAQEILV